MTLKDDEKMVDNEIISKISQYWFKEGHLNLDQRDLFIEVLKNLNPRYCLEIGFASGRSAVTTLVAAQPESLVSIDLSLDYITGARTHAALIARNFSNFRILEGNSIQILNDSFFASYFPKGVDFAFIDGDHTYEGCLADLNTVIPFMNSGGVILVDDYRSGPPNGTSFDSVTQAVDDFILGNPLSMNYWCCSGKGIAIIRKTDSYLCRLRTVLFIVPRTLFFKLRFLGSKIKYRFLRS